MSGSATDDRATPPRAVLPQARRPAVAPRFPARDQV